MRFSHTQNCVSDSSLQVLLKMCLAQCPAPVQSPVHTGCCVWVKGSTCQIDGYTIGGC